MRIKLLRKAVAIVLSFSTSGCITQALWKPAGETRAVQPQIAGVVANYPWPGARSLIVRYRANGDGTDVDLVVPIKPDGRAVAPFAITYVPFRSHGLVAAVTDQNQRLDFNREGSARPDDLQAAISILTGLTPDRVDSIVATESTISTDRQRLAAVLSSSSFTPALADPPFVRSDDGSDAGDTVHLLSYRFGAEGKLYVGAADALPRHWSDVGPQDLLIAVPTAVRRPPGDQGRNQLIAGALTPVTVAGDIGATALLVGLGGATLGVLLAVGIVALPIAGVVAIADSVGKSNSATSEPSH